VAGPCDDYSSTFLYRPYLCCDVLRIRPVTPSLVAEPPSHVPRRLCLSCDQMILVTHLFFLCSNVFARRSPLEPIPSLQVLTVDGNALGVLAGCRLISARRPFSTGGSAFPAGGMQAERFETAQRKISLLPASRPLRTFLSTIPFYSPMPISLLSYRTSYI
jgi:hypothetical protein